MLIESRRDVLGYTHTEARARPFNSIAKKRLAVSVIVIVITITILLMLQIDESNRNTSTNPLTSLPK